MSRKGRRRFGKGVARPRDGAAPEHALCGDLDRCLDSW